MHPALALAEQHGVRVWAEGDRLRYLPREAPLGVVEALRQHKPELLMLLRRRGCGNRLTLHEDHEHHWECDPNECYCWYQWQEPRLCPGVPCRWVWPVTSSDGGSDA